MKIKKSDLLRIIEEEAQEILSEGFAGLVPDVFAANQARRASQYTSSAAQSALQRATRFADRLGVSSDDAMALIRAG